MSKEKKYYAVNSKGLALTIQYLGGLNYYTYDNKKDSTRQVFSFEDTEQFRKVLNTVMELRNDFRKLNK